MADMKKHLCDNNKENLRQRRHRKARFRRRTSHEPNRMLMRENKGFFSFAFDSANVK